tara:strand:+ start:199 stop:639 length:441 start_codon:yes stop_codon:yes gene_type:complete
MTDTIVLETNQNNVNSLNKISDTFFKNNNDNLDNKTENTEVGNTEVGNTEMGNTEVENTDRILQLKKEIEEVDTFHHVKILEVFKKHNISYSENRNGIFVNITNLSKNIVTEIESVLKYVNTQEKQLQDMEKMKTTFKTTYFSNAQ